MEHLILRVLGFDMGSVSALSFVNMYLTHYLPYDNELTNMRSRVRNLSCRWITLAPTILSGVNLSVNYFGFFSKNRHLYKQDICKFDITSLVLRGIGAAGCRTFLAIFTFNHCCCLRCDGGAPWRPCNTLGNVILHHLRILALFLSFYLISLVFHKKKYNNFCLIAEFYRRDSPWSRCGSPAMHGRYMHPSITLLIGTAASHPRKILPQSISSCQYTAGLYLWTINLFVRRDVLLLLVLARFKPKYVSMLAEILLFWL